MDFVRQLFCRGHGCNTTDEYIPDVQHWLNAIDNPSLFLLSAGAAMTGFVTCLGLLHLIFVLKYIKDEQIRTDLYWLVFMPSVIAACGLVGMVLPRAAIFMYAIALVYYMICIFVLVCLMCTLNGSRKAMCRKLMAKGKRISIRVCPLCCCLFCFVKFEPTEKNFRRFEWLVFQSPIVRILLEIMNITVFLELSSRSNLFFQLSNLVSSFPFLSAPTLLCQSALRCCMNIVEQHSSVLSLWMIVLIFCSIAFLSFFLLLNLLCCRRRVQQKINATVRRSATANGIIRPTKKKLNLNGGVVVDRIDITSPIVVGANGKHSAPNGSQTDSGVFTLGSTSAAAAANAVAANGLNGGKMGGILLGRNISPSGDGEWVDGTVPSSPPQQQHQLEPYDFSNDPFLQEFAAANALGGIVVVENALHQSSSTESSPSIGQQGQQGKPPNPYTKFFNHFPSSLIGNGERTAAANGRRLATDRPTAEGEKGTNERGTGNSSNEQLISAGSSDSSASDSSSFRNGNAGGGVRVMREIIV